MWPYAFKRSKKLACNPFWLKFDVIKDFYVFSSVDEIFMSNVEELTFLEEIDQGMPWSISDPDYKGNNKVYYSTRIEVYESAVARELSEQQKILKEAKEKVRLFKREKLRQQKRMIRLVTKEYCLKGFKLPSMIYIRNVLSLLSFFGLKAFDIKLLLGLYVTSMVQSTILILV